MLSSCTSSEFLFLASKVLESCTVIFIYYLSCEKKRVGRASRGDSVELDSAPNNKCG